MPSIEWNSLPVSARRAIEARTGRVLHAEPTSVGRNSAVTACLHTESGVVFVKGTRKEDPRGWTLLREAELNPYVVPISPRLLWRVEVRGWDVLGFEHVRGRRADLSPSSPDLPKVAAVMRRLAALPRPDLPLQRLADRWSLFAEASELELLSGDTLLHTDLNPENILVDEATDEVHVVDWSWPALGAAWVDVAALVLRLVASGHTPAQADRWAAQFPSWAAAPAYAVDTLSAANAKVWTQIGSTVATCGGMMIAAQQWAAYRSVGSSRGRFT